MSNINDFINKIINNKNDAINISGGNTKKMVIPYPIETLYMFKPFLENNDIRIYDCTLELRQCYTNITEEYITRTTFIDKSKMINDIKELFNRKYFDIISKNDIFCYYSADLYGCNIIDDAIMIALNIPFEIISNCIINTKNNKYKLSYMEIILLLSRMYKYDPTSKFEWNGLKILNINIGLFYNKEDKIHFVDLIFMNLNIYGDDEPPITLSPLLHDKYEEVFDLDENIGNKIIKLIKS